MTHVQLWYRAVADVLVVRWGDELVHEIRDFSTDWPSVDRAQLAACTSDEVVRIIDERFDSLGPPPACVELSGAHLEEALQVGFDLELDVA